MNFKSIGIILLLLINISVLAQPLATIVKFEGKVKFLKDGSIKKNRVKVSQILNLNDIVITYKKAMATIKLNDGSLITLAENSKIKLTEENMLQHKGGKIFFSIKKRDITNLKIHVNFATIGVKGTKFIVVDNNDSKNVSLKNGLVNIESNDGEFELHKKKLKKLSMFEQYKLAQENKFNEYKVKLEKDFIEYKKQFDLKPDNTVSFDGKIVRESKISKDIKKEFLEFESFFK